MDDRIVKLYTDGACSGNPGPGGYCAVLKYGEHRKELTGGDGRTTNNRMELTAVLEGLKALKKPCDVFVYTDSRYITDAVNKNWLPNWKKKGWRNSANEPTPNVDLWEGLLPLLETHRVRFEWIKGHKGHKENEYCDKKAVEMSKKFSL
ncbi:MAG: ribonuclease HI [Oscillospiraceae bacterium]|nr:ribonuclease HI [Oscillospiraceae bacterium]